MNGIQCMLAGLLIGGGALGAERQTDTAAAENGFRFQGDRASSGFRNVRGPGAPRVKWKIRLEGWSSSPAIGPDGTVYVFAGRCLNAVSPRGRVQWTFAVPPSGPPPSLKPGEAREWTQQKFGGSMATHAPAVAEDGTIYFGITFHPSATPEDARLGLYALNSDGTQKWFFPTRHDVTSSPNLAEDGTVYFTTARALHAVRPDGTARWRVPREGERVKWSSPAVDARGVIYVVGAQLAAVRPDGTVMWRYTPADGPFKGFAGHPTIAADGTILVAVGARVHAVTAEGLPKWVSEVGWTEASPAIGPDGTVFIGTGGAPGRPSALTALEPEQGRVVWSYPVRTAVDSSPIVDAKGTIYFGSDDGFVYALTAAGQLGWRLDVGARPSHAGEVDATCALSADGTLYFGHAGGAGEERGLFFYAVSE